MYESQNKTNTTTRASQDLPRKPNHRVATDHQEGPLCWGIGYSRHDDEDDTPWWKYQLSWQCLRFQDGRKVSTIDSRRRSDNKQENDSQRILFEMRLIGSWQDNFSRRGIKIGFPTSGKCRPNACYKLQCTHYIASVWFCGYWIGFKARVIYRQQKHLLLWL